MVADQPVLDSWPAVRVDKHHTTNVPDPKQPGKQSIVLDRRDEVTVDDQHSSDGYEGGASGHDGAITNQ